METLVISNSRWRYVLLLLACVAFIVVGIFLLSIATTSGDYWAGWSCIILFAPAGAIFVWQIIDRRPRLTIDERGINDRTLGVGLIPWSEVTDAYVRSLGTNHFVCLVVRNPEAWIGKLTNARKAMVKANKVLGFTELNVNLSGTSAQPQEVQELILKLSADFQQRS